MANRPLLDTAFLFPVINDKLYIGQRATPPKEGFWGPIGGKSDRPTADNPWDQPRLVEKMGGHLAVSVADRFAQHQGREHLQGTAVREFCEEIFSELRFPRDFTRSDITEIVKLGAVFDTADVKGTMTDTNNFVYIAKVHRTDFSLSPREIRGFKPLTELTRDDRIFPIGKITLLQIHTSLKERIPPSLTGYEPLLDQISPLIQDGFLRTEECLFTSMMGPYMFPDFAASVQANLRLQNE